VCDHFLGEKREAGIVFQRGSLSEAERAKILWVEKEKIPSPIITVIKRPWRVGWAANIHTAHEKGSSNKEDARSLGAEKLAEVKQQDGSTGKTFSGKSHHSALKQAWSKACF